MKLNGFWFFHSVNFEANGWLVWVWGRTLQWCPASFSIKQGQTAFCGRGEGITNKNNFFIYLKANFNKVNSMQNNAYAGFISTESGRPVCMERPLFDRVETSGGNTLIITKARFCGIFIRPETHIIPEGFGSLFGFRARYNTCDPQILAALHIFWVKQIKRGEFQTLLTDVKWGRFAFPPEFECLGKYIVRLSA